MKIEIEFSEQDINDVKESVKQLLAERMFIAYSSEGVDFRRAVESAVKEVMYEKTMKAKLIDMTVKRASAEIKRKALPLLANELLEREK